MDPADPAGHSLPILRRGDCGGGRGRRMAGVDKIMADLGGEPLLVRTVRAFEATAVIREVVIVTRPDLIEAVSAACQAAGFGKVRAVIAGGDTRQASVQLGLAALEGVSLVAVQDGARPFATPQLIDRVVRAAHTYGAAAPAIGVKDTVKVAKGGVVVRTPDRSSLFAVQTPQVFDFDLLRGALSQAEKDGAAVTDDCSAVERLGMRIRLVEGEERNLKVTTRQDLLLARAMVQEDWE